MKRSPLSPLNKALYERLKNQMNTPVYDYVPAGKKAPGPKAGRKVRNEGQSNETGSSDAMPQP